jgi:hypothetical protein
MVVIMLTSSCSMLSLVRKSRIAKSPSGTFYTSLNDFDMRDGYPRQKTWWVVYSDRDNNTTNVGRKNEIPQKKLPFLEPMYITKIKDDYVKVVRYMPDMDLSAKRGRVDKRTLKSLGWIKKDKLLLWSNALKDINSGFFAKAITCVSGASLINNSEKFLATNYSLSIFTTPDLTIKSTQTVPLGTPVYIYKQSDDKKSFLIGHTEKTTPENIKQTLLGWISADALSLWGTRSGFTIAIDSLKKINNKTGLYATELEAVKADSTPLLRIEDMETRTTFENIYPIQNTNIIEDSIIETSCLENILDYSKNKVLNVLGNPIYYPQYKNIIRNGQRINIVFVIDASSNNHLYFPSIKAILQDLQFYFDTATLFKSHHFGAVVYKQTNCNNNNNIPNAFSLTSNYNEIVRFIDNKEKQLNCEDETIYQPVYKGITEACKLLEPVKDETNIIVLIGTAGNNNEAFNSYNLNEVITDITKVKARLMLFQSISKASDAYNDFVLEAQKTVTSSARNLGELKKEKMVEINDIITNVNYNLITADSGVYFLDYPNRSMTQGFVLFPKKGEAMQPRLLKQNFETLLQQIISDNAKINNALQSYFRSIGIKTTSIKKSFSNYFDSVPNPLPDNFSKSFIDEQKGFFIPAYIQAQPFSPSAQIPEYGILLSDEEYDKMIQQFYSIYQSTVATEIFRRRRAYRRYKRIIKKFTKANQINNAIPIDKMTAAETLYLLSGYISTDSLLTNISISSLKNNHDISKETLLNFYYNFKYAADMLLENKNKIQTKLYFGDTPFYWVDKNLMP